MRSIFTLLVVTSSDGFIARDAIHAPGTWASAEEQALFLAEVDAADWSVMGRHTHEAADKAQRRRIVFTGSAAEPAWRRRTQLWLDPADLTPDDLARLVASVRPLRRGLILGGTRVHDWFHATGRIDRVLLTVEPVAFAAGLTVFSGMTGPAETVFARLGYRPVSERTLNPAGTRLVDLRRG